MSSRISTIILSTSAYYFCAQYASGCSGGRCARPAQVQQAEPLQLILFQCFFWATSLAIFLPASDRPTDRHSKVHTLMRLMRSSRTTTLGFVRHTKNHHIDTIRSASSSANNSRRAKGVVPNAFKSNIVEPSLK